MKHREFKAFPWGAQNHIDGMTLRDYFAAKAMQQFLAWDLTVEPYNQNGMDWAAKYSYEMADKMILARKEKENGV